MKLSIIVPAYNAEETLADCLQSLVGQTVEEKEIIVIDDGSTDRTPEILASFPVVSRRVENGGQGRARNIGLSMATGDYIGFVDSDDRAEKDMYEKLLRAAEGEGADIALCDAMGHYPDGRQEPERIWREDRPMAAAGFASNKLFRRELLESVRFPEEKLWYEDTEFCAKAIHRAKKIIHIPEALYHYRRGFPSTMNNSNALKNLDILEVMEHLEEDFGEESGEELDFLIINHVLLDAINRVQPMKGEERDMVLQHLRAYVRVKIPRLGSCEAFRQESRNRRIIMRLNYMGLSGLSSLVLNSKKKMSESNESGSRPTH